MNISVSINNRINTLLLRKQNKKFLLLFSQNYYIKYQINDQVSIYFNKNSRTLVLNTPLFLTNYNKIQKNIFQISYSITNYYCKKIKFTGKSYKIKKTQTHFAFEFNKAHTELVIWKNIFLKKLKKNKILLKGVGYKHISACNNQIINIRKINPFTKRGLIGSRSMVKKKVGKKSS